jgi:hypothetical protein
MHEALRSRRRDMGLSALLNPGLPFDEVIDHGDVPVRSERMPGSDGRDESQDSE